MTEQEREVLRLLCEVAINDGIPISMGKEAYDKLRAFAEEKPQPVYEPISCGTGNEPKPAERGWCPCGGIIVDGWCQKCGGLYASKAGG